MSLRTPTNQFPAHFTVRLNLLELESRDVPSAFYNLTTVTLTGGPEGFMRFGDLVSMNSAGDVAFVGYTDKFRDGPNGEPTPGPDGRLESGLWVQTWTDATLTPDPIENINPTFSKNPNRDFGRAAEINNNDIVAAVDRVAGAPGQFFLRAWLPGQPREDEIRASAQNWLQPDFGRYSAISTFADINDNGDMAFVALSADGQSRLLVFQPAAGNAIPVYSFPIVGSVSRPQLTNGGRILHRLSNSSLVLVNPYSMQFEVVANGFTDLGYAAGMSDRGDVVVFSGNRGSGNGIFLAHRTATGFSQPILLAGERQGGWTDASFDLKDAVRVNNTLAAERGVTVAFEANHPVVGRGIYTSRVSFFGPNAATFDPTNPQSVRVSAAIPVVTDQAGEPNLGGKKVVDVELWNGVNDLRRGELVFWAQLEGGQERVLRAIPTPVVWVDFKPQSGPAPVSSAVQNLLLLDTFGLKSGWSADFNDALKAAGLPATTDFDQLHIQIVNQVQSYFDGAQVRVSVLGKPGETPPLFVPQPDVNQIPGGATYTLDRGAFMTVQVGGAPANHQHRWTNGAYLHGMASGPLQLIDPATGRPVIDQYTGRPVTMLDYFNQVQDDLALVFGDAILTQLKNEGSSPGTISIPTLATAVARTIAHESGHNLGLVHLDTRSNLDLMNARAEYAGELVAPGQEFRDVAVQTQEITGVIENSRRRLWFAVGGPRSGAAPAPQFLTADQVSLYSLGGTVTTPTTVSRLVAGLVSDEDTMPTFIDLGSGDLATLLSNTRIPARSGMKVLLLGSTNGTVLDVIGVAAGQEAALSSLDLTQLGIATDPRLLTTVGTGAGLTLQRLAGGGATQIGSVTVQGAPALEVSANDGPLSPDGTLGLGSTRRGGADLTRTLTLRNTGTASLTLGVVAVTGAGYSVTQPSSTTLAPGAMTTVAVTLSSTTPGLGIVGVVTVPTDMPSGAFVVNLRGDVTAMPDVLAVTRLADAGGKLVVAIDFSEQLQTGPATDPKNFALISPGGTGLALASAAYTEAGGIYRVTLTSTASGPFPYGQYGVRFDGTAIRSLSGTPAAEPGDRLVVGVQGNLLATVAPTTIGGFQLSGDLQHLGVGKPSWIEMGDLNGDGVDDLVTTSSETSQLVVFPGRIEGGFEDPTYLDVAPSPAGASLFNRVVIADWNLDGRPDLVVSDVGASRRILIFLNNGRGGFSPAPDTPIPVGNRFSDILGVGDFTGDGVPDIAANVGVDAPGTFWGYTGAIGIYGKDPFVGYNQVAVLPTGNDRWFPATAALGDFNGDGRPDLVVATSGYYGDDPGYVYYLSTPTGLGAARVLDYDGFGADGVQVGDYNGDGRVDIALSYDLYRNSYGVNEGVVIQLALGDGQGGFTKLPYQGLGRRGVSLVASGDLDGDGQLDLLLRAKTWPEWGTAEPSVLPLYGKGDGTFSGRGGTASRPGTLSPISPSGNYTPGNFVLRDVTGDGFPDAVYGNTSGNRIGLLSNDTTGVLRSTVASGPTTGSFRPEPANYIEPEYRTADFNRDGIPDLLRIASGLDILLGRADGGYSVQYSIPYPYPNPTQGIWSQIGDVNRDGILDLVVGMKYVTTDPMATTHLGNGDGTFRTGLNVQPPPGDEGPGGLTLADVNRDGNPDLVQTLTTLPGYSYTPTGYGVHFGDGTGKFVFNPNTVTAVSSLNDLRAPTVADVTGDGVPDIVARISQSVRVLPGRGNGTFGTAIDSSPAAGDSGTSVITLIDFNGDGLADIARFSGNVVYLYANTGGGHFSALGSVTIPSYVFSSYGPGQIISSLAGGDFDRDGQVDLGVSLSRAYAGYGDTTPWTQAVVLRGDGAGGFTPVFYEVGTNIPTALAVISADAWVDAGTVTPALPPPPPPPPGGLPLGVTTAQGTPVVVVPPSVPGIPQLIALATPPAHGTVRIDDNGTPNNAGDDRFVYVPAPGYFGPDTWSYAAGNAGGATAGTVSMTVTPGPQFRFEAAAYSASPLQTWVNLRVVRDRDTNGTATVVVRTVAGGTLSAGQYTPLMETLTFTPGETVKTVTVFRAASIPATGTVLVALTTEPSGSVVSPETTVVTFRQVANPTAFNVIGYAYRDDNDNGIRDAGESGLAGARVFADVNANSTWDPNEPSGISAPDGYYELALPTTGSFSVRAADTTGHFYPDGVFTVNGATGGRMVAINFRYRPLPALPFSDPFPDDGSHYFGHLWNTMSGSFYTGNGNVVGTAGGSNVAVVKSISAADVAVSAVVKSQWYGPLTATGLVARYGGSGDRNMYWGALNTFDNTSRYSAQIWKNVNGVWSVLNFNAVPIDAAFAVGKTLRFEVLGSSLKLYLDDVLVSYAFDTSLTAPGAIGIRSGSGATLDDFAVVSRPAVAAHLPFGEAFAANPPRQTLPTTWQERAGYFTVLGGQATGRAARANTATLNGVLATDVAVSAVVRPQNGSLLATGLVARYSGTGDAGSPTATMYWGALNVFGGPPHTQYSAQIWKIVNGVAAPLTFNAIPIDPANAVGKTLRFEVFGASLKLYLGDTLLCYAVDTTITAGGSAGLRTGQGSVLDDFAVAVLTPTIPVVPGFTDPFNPAPPRNTLPTDWQERSGFFSVASGRAVGGAAGQTNLATLNGVRVADVTIEASFHFTAAGQTAGLVGRYQGATGTVNSNLYLAECTAQPNGDALLRILKNIGGTVTELGSRTVVGTFSGGFAVPVTGFSFRLLGNQLTILLAGVSQLTVADTTFATGSVGIRTDRGVGVDDFATTVPQADPAMGGRALPLTVTPVASSVLATAVPSSGPNGTEVRVLDPVAAAVTRTFVPFPGFTGAVDVAVGDFNGDGVADVAAGAGAGGGPRVVVLDGTTGGMLASLYVFSEGFTGGVDVAVGDVTGDGTPDLVVAAGPGGGPHVRVLDGRSFGEVMSFYAYTSTYRGGVIVAAGDVTGDGRADIVTGTGPGAGPHVQVFSGTDLAVVYNFFAFPPVFAGGASVAVGDVNGDGFADLIVGAGDTPQVAVFDGRDGRNSGTLLAFALPFAGGVRVGVTDADADGKADIVAAAGPGGDPAVSVFDGETFALFSSLPAFGSDLHSGVSVS